MHHNRLLLVAALHALASIPARARHAPVETDPGPVFTDSPREPRTYTITLAQAPVPVLIHQVDTDRHREPWRRKNRRGR